MWITRRSEKLGFSYRGPEAPAKTRDHQESSPRESSGAGSGAVDDVNSIPGIAVTPRIPVRPVHVEHAAQDILIAAGPSWDLLEFIGAYQFAQRYRDGNTRRPQ